VVVPQPSLLQHRHIPKPFCHVLWQSGLQIKFLSFRFCVPEKHGIQVQERNAFEFNLPDPQHLLVFWHTFS